MILMFRGAILSLDTFESLSIQPVGDDLYAVILSPTSTTVHETDRRVEAEEYVATVARGLKKAVSMDAQWVVFSGTPGYAEIGMGVCE